MSEAERLYTAAEYLAFDRAAPERHEFVDGRIYAMSGGSPVHGKIAANVIFALKTALRGRDCDVYGSDVRVHIPAIVKYTYPDVSALCGDTRTVDDGHDDNFLNPSLIVEVLSPSTERHDRTRKFADYRRLDTVREYVLVAQDRVHVECFRRDDEWRSTVHTALSDVVELPSVHTTLALDHVYDRVTFVPPRSRPRVVREPIADIHAYAARRFRDGFVVDA